MSVIVTDRGFHDEAPIPAFTTLAQLPYHEGALDLSNTDDPTALTLYLADIRLIRIDFPSFADGRGFTLARRLRMMGFAGRLRARGHVLADQYAMARRVGFDEVEINDDLAARQPADQWLARADWQAHDHQSRLRAG
ncbi:protein of unknown function [Pseudorhodobacter antarcticus]|jgi:uncharacterized protein (DUF934 family)|uniref:DUF934 domain-containing protein n=1 Tax=Pseudorhodobacter antarcticus TaxID=1077947 RepID=A0A1H8KEX3_9RHOB|nr:DUF934 domain-containing protein [Pseudorhodobacter antarcticus]SEN91116.1 protein of unknown function [Pseudorhodobacter antarcticus]